MRVLLLCATAAVLLVPGSAWGASVLSPADGATVPARPTFTFDFVEGRAQVSLSRSPELNEAGDDAGEFVDVADRAPLYLADTDPVPGRATWSDPIKAGNYFWHARMSEFTGILDETPAVWSPVRRITVADEPITFAGWLVRAKRLKRTRSCATPVRVTGKVNYEDNAPGEEVVRYRLALTGGGKTVATISGRDRPLLGSFSFAGVACVRARRLAATLTLIDKAGHRSPGPVRALAF